MAAGERGPTRHHMTGETTHSAADPPPDEEPQHSLDERLGVVDAKQCEAFADSTGERCQQDAMEPFPYCADHKHLLDDVDLRRMGLKPPKSGG